MNAFSVHPCVQIDSTRRTVPEVTSKSTYLDWDALQVALTRLDHSPQNYKASIGRSGALSNRRPPSRSSRASSHASRKSSIDRLEDFAGLDEDLVVPKIVNIEIRLEGEEKREEKVKVEESKSETTFNLRHQSHKSESKSVEDILCNSKFSLRDNNKNSFYQRKQGIANNIFKSTPLLSNFPDNLSVSSDIILRNIKNTYSKEVKSEGYKTPNTFDSQSDQSSTYSYPFPRISKEKYDNVESSSETEVIISDRESIADSGIVNRRTVIKICEKSKSASNLDKEKTTSEWVRDLRHRRSLRASKELEKVDLIASPEFCGGINVSIKNPAENNEVKRRDSTSRMYVRQGDIENRPARASAFNVRRTIQKRQIQQERRERKALREQIREHLRSLSEGRERKESSCSSISSTNQSSASVRSKSLSSLDQDHDDLRSESPLFKAQSSPTLDSEKEGIRTYLFGSNLSDSSVLRSSLLVSRIMSPTFSDLNRPDTVNSSEDLSRNYHDKNISKSDISLSNARDFNERLTNFKVHSAEKVNHHQNKILFGGSASNISNGSNIDNFLNKKFNTEENKTITNCPNCGNIRRTASTSDASAFNNLRSSEHQRRPEEYSPIPPPRRRSRVSRSTGQLTVEKDDKPAWLRLAKERRSLRGTKTYSDISDRASSIVAPEPEWVTKARKRLESMNVCLTSTTDTVSVNSQITESSAWSRGGLDALEDLREEVNRISEELADEATEKVERDLGITDRVRSTNMLEYHPITHSRDHSVERQRVSFDGTAVQNEKTRKLSLQNLQKDEVRFGDLKHDWGGAQIKSSRAVNGKLKETRFSNDRISETTSDKNVEETNNNDITSNKQADKDYVLPEYVNMQNGDIMRSNSKTDKLLVMHFGDTPQDIFTKSTSKVKSQSSSKFESIPGPDPLKMTAEELNQNVEEYDFPIPTGKEDATELLNYLKANLNKREIVPEFVSNEDSKPKPKSILKRKSMENVFLETKTEAKTEISNSPKPQLGSSATEETSKIDEGVAVTELLKPKSFVSKYEDKYHNHAQPVTTAKVPVSSSREPGVPGAKVYTFSFNPYQKDFPTSSTKDEGSEEISKTYFGDVVSHSKSSETFSDSKNVTKFITNSFENEDSSKRLLTKTEKVTRRDDLFGRRSLRESSTRARAPLPSIHSSKSSKALNNDSNPIVQLIQKSPESCKKDIYHYTPKEVNIDIIDANRRSLPSSLEKRRNKSSLFEWEAMQRQRLEDEEKNRLNKTLSIKPVSNKIKDLVKLHSGIVASMFTKDKRGEYNGTVDAKEEIFFQKIPNNAKPEIPPRNFSNSMKSPYIVQNILNSKPDQEKEAILKDKTINNFKPRQDKKAITPSLEREAYMFNQRNIYIEDDTIQRQRTKEKRQHIENVQSLIGRREKKYELSESKLYHPDINKIDFEKNLVKSKNNYNNINKSEENKSPYKRKEWINNVLNNLSNEKHETIDKTEKTGSLTEDSSVTDLKRSSVYRRTIHECLPRKETPKEVPVKRSSADDSVKVHKNILESNIHRKDVPIKKCRDDELVTEQKNILESNFQRKDSKRLYLKKGEGRGPVNLTSIIGDTPSASSSNVSSPLTSPRSSPERRISNDYFKMSPISETRKYISADLEKENVCPIKNKLENDYDNIFKCENSYLASTGNHTSSSAVKSLLDRSDPNRRSLSKLLLAWEERASKERSTSPAAYSDSTTDIKGYRVDPLSGYPIPSKSHRERTLSLRSSSSIRSTPDRDRPVSLSSILERDVSSPTSSTHRHSISEELNELTQNYRKEKAKKLLSNEDEKISDNKPNYLFGMPIEGIHDTNSHKTNANINALKNPIKNYSHSSSKPLDTNRKRSHQKDAKKTYTKTVKKQVKESHVYNDSDIQQSRSSKKEDVRPSFQTKPTSKDLARPKLVRRKSSLKRSQSGDSSSLSSFRRDSKRDPKRDLKLKEKVHAKKSKDSDTASERYESIRQNPDGSKTKTSVRKVRLSSTSNPDKIISRSERDKNSQERFKLDASRDLEKWAAGTKVQGQLVKKEGQRYVQHVEEEMEDGKKTSKAVSRRVVRRGSRRLSHGGELVSETKEMTSGDPSGKSSDMEPHQGENSVSSALVPRTSGLDPTSRKLKSSTDGERYVTQSITTEGGIQRFTTEGVDNKTTKCVEVIGGDGWEGEREVKGRHGERLIVEQSVGVGGRPSTVVKKSTSQSKVIITKTKKKALNI